MKKIIILLLLAITAPSFNGCSDPMKDDILAAYDKQPIGLYLRSRPEFSEWVKLLEYTDTYNALNVDNKHTCFVPDNTTFLAWLQKNGYNRVEDIPLSLATSMARYTVIVGNAYANAAFGDGRLIDSTASGDYLITKYREGGINAIYVNDYARIVEKDINTLNGIIHVIDQVLVPVTDNLWETIIKKTEYSVFRQALEKTALNTVLEETRVNGFKVYRSVMMVSDSVFGANQIETIEDLIKSLSPGREDYTDVSNPLYCYVAYHLVGGNLSVSDLGTFPANTKSKNVNTFAANELFCVDDIGSRLFINKNGDDYIRFIPGKYDIQAKNGYIHEVDKLMPVYSPKPAKMLFEFTDYPELAAISFYRTWPASRSTERLTPATTPAQIRWKTIPENAADVWYESRSNYTGMMFRDMIAAKLGDVGWIEFELPQIVKGKYKISIYRNVYPGRGIFQPFFDNTRLGGTVNFAAGATLLELGAREFKTTGTHSIRFSVVKKGDNEENIGLDYILFEPITE